MNSDPSAAWMLLRLDIWARGLVTGSVSMKAAPSGPMATRMRPRLHGHAARESATATAITVVPTAMKATRINTP